MRSQKKYFSVFVICAIIIGSCVPLTQAAGKPNVVLVFLDNFGWGEPGFNGGGIA
jgi:arylsulfatase